MRPSPAAPAGRVRPSSNYPPKKAPRSSSATCGASRARPGTDSDPLKPGLAACSPWRPTRRDRPALVRLLLALLRSLTCPEGADPQWSSQTDPFLTAPHDRPKNTRASTEPAGGKSGAKKQPQMDVSAGQNTEVFPAAFRRSSCVRIASGQGRRARFGRFFRGSW